MSSNFNPNFNFSGSKMTQLRHDEIEKIRSEMDLASENTYIKIS